MSSWSVKRYDAAGGVICVGEAMLLLDRPGRGEVRLPKGHIEAGESAEETALRETAEETGYVELEIAADLGSSLVEFDYDGRHYMRNEHYFLMRLAGDGQAVRPPKDAEQFVVCWTPLAEAADVLTYAAEQEVARRAIAAYRVLTGGPAEAR